MSAPAAPPAVRRLVDEARLLACIHCGFCLPTCPTYVVLGDEADSPRGRIALIRAMQEGRLDPTPEVRTHLDRCLTCFACETACPSGVRYRELIEDARGWLAANAPSPLPRGFRWFFRRVLPSAAALRSTLGPLRIAAGFGLREPLVRLVRRLPLGWLARAVDLLPDRLPAAGEPPLPQVMPAKGAKRMRVGYLPGCVMEGTLPDLNRLAIALLRELGCEVVVPRDAGCCGALAVHQGERDLAAGLARDLVGAFAGTRVDVIVASAAGCGSTMKDYGHLFADPAAAEFAGRVRDLTEVLAGLAKDRPPDRPVRLRVAYQEACHLAHGQKVTAEPRALLAAVPGLEVTELPEQELCCGSAGVYNLLQPDLADRLRDRKAALVRDAGVDAVVTGNPGCWLQLRAGLRDGPPGPRVRHLVEVLAAAYGVTGAVAV